MRTPSATPQPWELSGKADLAEGPVWDDRRQRFLWVDISNGRLHWIDQGMSQRGKIEIDEPLGFVALTEHPETVVIGRGAGVALLDTGTGRLKRMIELDDNPGMRCNDGKCDPTGRLWVGTMPRTGKAARAGGLYSISPEFQTRKQLGDIGISNGLAWNCKRTAFYFVDSPTRTVDRFDWNPLRGTITNRRVLARFGDRDGFPDGMTIDTWGNLWVAFWGGGCVRQIDGETGETLEEIGLPADQVSSCTFGGPDLDTLYITTAANGLGPDELSRQSLAGTVFTVKVEARGNPPDRFPFQGVPFPTP